MLCFTVYCDIHVCYYLLSISTWLTCLVFITVYIYVTYLYGAHYCLYLHVVFCNFPHRCASITTNLGQHVCDVYPIIAYLP